MKKYIINKCINLVRSIYPEYNESKLDEIRYGLESIYLSLTKVIVILTVCFLLGIFKEAILLLLFFNGIRLFAFGIHAQKSWMCWISSSILFIGFPYLCIYLKLPIIFYLISLALSFITIIIYAPADTVKRPLVRKNRRIKFKILSILVCIIYFIIFYFNNDFFIRNIITSSLLIESVLIHPLTYKVFKLPYRNYERYVFSNKNNIEGRIEK